MMMMMMNSSSNAMYHRITHIELHQCTKFGVASSKLPRTGGPLSNTVFRTWRVHLASHENGNRKKRSGQGSIRVTCKFGIGGAHRLACSGGKRRKCTKHLHVRCTCIVHSSSLNRTVPSTLCQGQPTYRVWCHWLKISLHRRTPR